MDILESLVKTIKENASKKSEVVERIFLWITENITYDIQAFKERTLNALGSDTNTLLTDVLKSRKALCVGYSHLFEVMCRLCEVECVRVSGFCKGYDYRPGDTFEDTEPNHEWNCVNLDGVWSLVDCCWGAGYFDETSGGFIQAQRKLYCFTDPSVFILDHFPVDPKWQLLCSPMDLQTFETTANVKYGYVIHSVQLFNHKEAVIRCKEKCNIQLSFPKPLDISYRLLDKNLISVDAYVDYWLQEKHVNVQCTLPFAGRFTLVVYGKERDNDESSFKSIVSYAIDNTLETSGCNLDQSHGLCRRFWGPTTRFHEMKLQQCLPIQTSLSHNFAKRALCMTYFSTNPYLQLKGDLYRNHTVAQGKINNQTFTNRSANGERQLLVTVPETGDYVLKLYARHNCNEDFQTVASYQIKSMTSTSIIKSFPQMTVRWLQGNCSLLSPTSGLLRQNENVHFRLMIEDALDVVIILPGKDTVKLKSKGAHIWERTISLGSAEGNAQIFVKTPGDKCYYKYLQFKIKKKTM